MKVVADLHIHSKYALATSRDTDLDHLALGARAKGITLLGTGDFTHPKWLAELREKLEPLSDSALYTYGGRIWMLSAEVSTVYEQGGRKRKVHHLIYAPGFDEVAQVNEIIGRHGKLDSDGRPILTGIDSAELAEAVTGVSSQMVVIPAHAWTPWFGVFGSKSGFDSLEECYKDQAGKIFALETGLSSDPEMNWRLSALDGLGLMSNSDAHSPNPWRLGREANVFDLPAPGYRELFDAVRRRDLTRFLYTVEVDPSYGKYHYSGHKKCGVSLAPAEAKGLGNRCPKCGKKLTVGVLQRVEELADRPEGFRLPGAVPFKRLLPLYEVISFATGVNRLYAKSVLELQDKLIARFGNELAVLVDVPEGILASVVPPRVARAIVGSREGSVKVVPGYDGVYGVPVFTG
jgi:uncharacterized protein (TIGR00375 family)